MIKTLKDLPQKKAQTLSLIETSFDYSSDNSFEIDFYPLMKDENAANNFILLEGDKVIGHIGIVYKELKLSLRSFLIPMLGGIAIDKDYRGKGKFKPFFNQVLASIKDSPFFLLWSDKLDLYEHFDFYPCIEQFEYTGNLEMDNPNYIKMKLSELSDKEIKELSIIYNNSQELRYERSIEDWIELKKISSSDIYIKKENNIIKNYFFMNKGEDLSDIIYEYGDVDDIEEMSTYGILWSPWNFEVENEQHKTLLYAALIRINNFESFKQFVFLYSNELERDEILFTFEEKQMKISKMEFLQGIFGPNKFSELEQTKKILISGIDSI